MKTINLEEIYLKHVGKGVNMHSVYYQRTIDAMREACFQAIDACAKNALVRPEDDGLILNFPLFVVDKKSILKTKEQI